MTFTTHQPPSRRDANDICRYFWKEGIETAYDAKQAGSAASRYRHIETIKHGSHELVHVRVQDIQGLSPRLARALLLSGNVYVMSPDGRVSELADHYVHPVVVNDAQRVSSARSAEHSGYYIDFHALEQAALKSADIGLAQYL